MLLCYHCSACRSLTIANNFIVTARWLSFTALFFYYLKTCTHCIEYSKNKRAFGAMNECYEWMIWDEVKKCTNFTALVVFSHWECVLAKEEMTPKWHQTLSRTEWSLREVPKKLKNLYADGNSHIGGGGRVQNILRPSYPQGSCLQWKFIFV